MLKLLIVDDEPHVREGLADLIDWGQIGLEVCGIGVNGKDGVEKIRALQPDICLIDIRMPGLTGIEAIRQVKEEGLDCQFIILSGYSDFKYAKEAIALEVHDYLLKPVDEDELLETAKRICGKLQSKVQYEKYKGMEQLRKILQGDSFDLEKGYYDARYQLAAFGKSSDDSALLEKLERLEKAQLLRDERLLIFLNEEAKTVSQKLNPLIAKYQVPMALSDQSLNAHQVKRAYEEVEKLLERSFFFKEPSLMTAETLKTSKSGSPLNMDELFRSIELGNRFNKEQLLRELTHYYQHTSSPVDQVKGELANLQLQLLEKFQNQYPNLKFPKKETLMNTIYRHDNLHVILSGFAKEWDRISAEIEDYSGLEDQLVKKIQHYIERYYYESLSLQLVGELFNYNPTYLGKKFKEETGESFPKYVDRVRIENAKQLLTREKLKVYEVSDRVGYCNIDYFYRKFKHHVGKSPKEFQKEFKLEEDAS